MDHRAEVIVASRSRRIAGTYGRTWWMSLLRLIAPPSRQLSDRPLRVILSLCWQAI